MAKALQGITRKPGFWIFQVLLFFLCVFLSFRYYPKAFPLVDLSIKMSRTEALEKASSLSKLHRWGPTQEEGRVRETASFDVDSRTQTFIELSAGGSAAFAKLLKDKLYSPYTWTVR